MEARAGGVFLVKVARVLALVEDGLLIGFSSLDALSSKVDDRGLATLVERGERTGKACRYGSTAPALSVRCLERAATDGEHLDGIVTTGIAVIVRGVVELHGQDVLPVVLTGVGADFLPSRGIAALPVRAGTIPQILIQRYQLVLAAGNDVLQTLQYLSLGDTCGFLAINTRVEQVCASQEGLGSIAGNASVVAGGGLLGIGIGRNMLGSILQVVEDDSIDVIDRSLRDILRRGNSQQGDILEHTYQVEIQDATHGTSLTNQRTLSCLA